MEIEAYKNNQIPSLIQQMSVQRDWMDRTFDRHAYHCFPMSLANSLGWSISFNEDISFIWDGVESSESGHTKIIKGGSYVSSRRENATVSFDTGIIFSPEKNISLLTIPPSNVFIDGVQTITTLISTSALVGEFPVAMMITRPNTEILIPANTPVCTIIPISLKDMNEQSIKIKNGRPSFTNDLKWKKRMSGRSTISQELNSQGKWTHFYRDAVDHNGEKMGEHEVKKIVMGVYYE